MDWRYRGCSWPFAARVRGRRGIFIGQCCLPLCPGDLATHLDGSPAVTKYRQSRELDQLRGLQQVREPGPPSRPKRDASRTIFAWPLHRPRLPGDPGCVPPSTLSSRERAFIVVDGVRAKTSGRAWTRPGRIKFRFTSFANETAPFKTKPQHLRLTPNPKRKRSKSFSLPRLRFGLVWADE